MIYNMKSISLFSLGFAALVLSAGSLAAADEAGVPPVPAQKPVKNPEGWPVLKKGMPAADVLRLIGKPDLVQPMDTKEGKAEVWIYRRLAKTVHQQSATGVASIPAFTGMGLGNDATGTASTLTYRMEEISIYQVSSLLMFDGKMAAASQKVERESRFE
jgi:hypothetical protein